MPLYQYRCRECGTELEARQKFSDDPLEKCPTCGAEQGLYRIIQAAGVVFKGSGFYINDSKGSKRDITAPAKKNGSSETAASTSSTSESSSSTTESSTPAASSSTPAKETA